MPDRRPLPPACLLKDGYGILSGEMEAVSLEDMQIGEWRIAFDKNATRRLYSHLDPVDAACPCAAYQNYVRAATRFPPDVTAFFASLGIDGAKPAEIYACESRDGRVYYTGFYPLVGNRLSGDDAQRLDAPEPLGQTGADMWTLADGFRVGFTQPPDKPSSRCSGPLLQMDIAFLVPWVLDVPFDGGPPAGSRSTEERARVNKARLLSALEDVIDLSLLHTEGDEWIIDSVHRLGVEFGGDSTIVFFLDEHTHFWEMDNNEEYDFIEETASYVRTLLSGQTRFDRTFRGRKMVRMAIYTKSRGSDSWTELENFGTALFRPLFHFPKKTVESDIVEFRQR